MSKALIISIVLSLSIIIFAVWIVSKRDVFTDDSISNVTIDDGVQIVTIDARGGYSPKKSTARAGIPTIVRFTTNGTFDCSAAVSIPSIGEYMLLPLSGVTDVSLGTSTKGVLDGTCSMGMYSFSIKFE
jgi:plastocyanin domain-containing protein